MADRNISIKPRDIDRSLNRLLAVADGDSRDPSFIEPMVLLLDRLAGKAEPSVFEHYCTLYSPVIMYAISQIPTSSLSYDVLAKMPTLVARVKVIAPQSVPPNIELRLGDVYERLAFLEMSFGDEAKARTHLAAAKKIGLQGISVQERIEAFRREHAELLKRTTQDAITFVTVYPDDGRTDEPGLGRLIQAAGRIEITGEWSMFKRFERIVAFEGRTLRADDPFDRQIKIASAFAEGTFVREMGIGEISKMPREYHFSLSGGDRSSRLKARSTGGSAGLAFALLSLTAIDALAVRRERRLIRESAAFTGTIDEAGAVQAVDDAALGAKVRSVFLSTCSSLVLPKSNFAAAIGHLDGLKEKYPRRSMELVPVEHVRDAYDDERIVERRRYSNAHVVLNEAKRRRKHLVAGFSALTALVTLLMLLPPRFAREIATYDFENGRISLFNKYGYNFRNFDLGYRVLNVPAIGRTPDDPDDTKSKAFEFFPSDINGDGSNELVFASVESDNSDTNPCGRFHIHVFSGSGSLIDTISWSDSLVHTRGLERNTFKKFYYNHGEPVDLDGDKRADHLAFSLTQREQNPGVVGLYSLVDGTLRSFVHIGYIQHLAAGDFDGDGKAEIVAAGVNNGLEAGGVVVVLDPERMNGSSPDAFEWRFEGFPEDVAKYYIRLPKSALMSVPEIAKGNPGVYRINVEDDGTLSFGVSEASYELLYYFDHNFSCTRAVPLEDYTHQYGLLRKAYGLPDLESHLAELKNQVEYWTGDGWTRTPTMNKSYLRLISSMSAR